MSKYFGTDGFRGCNPETNMSKQLGKSINHS